MALQSATTISLTLLSLIFTVTLSLATDCPGNTVPEVLKHYNIPGGLFPDNVQDFECTPVDSNHLRLSIKLKGACTVTTTINLILFTIREVVKCEQEISAIISRDQLSDIKGVTSTPPFSIKPMTVSDVVISGGSLKFYSKDGEVSPPFPIFMFPNIPPKCDKSSGVFAYSGESGGVVVTKEDGDVPIWVYKYGRLLPFVAA